MILESMALALLALNWPRNREKMARADKLLALGFKGELNIVNDLIKISFRTPSGIAS